MRTNTPARHRDTVVSESMCISSGLKRMCLSAAALCRAAAQELYSVTTCGYPRDKADSTNKTYLEDFLWYQYCCDFTFGGAACQPSALVSQLRTALSWSRKTLTVRIQKARICAY